MRPGVRGVPVQAARFAGVIAPLLLAVGAACGDDSAGSLAPSDGGIGDGGGGEGGGGANGANGGEGGASVPDGASEGGASDAATDPPATLEDYWNQKATFVLDSVFQTPSTVPNNALAFSVYNANTDIVVAGGAWYLFAREFVDPKPAACGAAGVPDSARTTVRTSFDRGKTWPTKVTVVDQIAGTPHECDALDGDAFYDAPSNHWHFLYQCMDRNRVWNVCHASHVGRVPDALFDDDPNNPVIKNGELWKAIAGGGSPLHDEGTPAILGKVGADFYVSFHGIDANSPIDVVRGIAKTADFVHYAPVNGGPIFTKADCAKWDVPWISPGCYGGGAAGTELVGGHYYSVIESADRSGGCVADQNWVFGMIRTTDPTQAGWEPMPHPAMVFSTLEKQAGHSPACALGYPRLFVGDDGVQRLALFRGGTDKPAPDLDPAHGHFLYSLQKGAPVVDYEFREGAGHVYTQSDVVSRGDLQAETGNVTWIPEADGTYSLAFGGVNSFVRAARPAPAFEVTTSIRVAVRARIDALPTTAKSALVAGKVYSYWQELYPDGRLCFIVFASATDLASACTNVSADLGAMHVYEGRYDGASVRLLIDGALVAKSAYTKPLAHSDVPFSIGSGGPNAAGLYGSFQGAVDWVRVYD